MSEVRFKENLKRLSLALLAGVMVLIIGVFALIVVDTLFEKVVCVITILFGLLSIVLSVRRIVKNETRLIINEQGFVNKTALYQNSLGFIPWEHVENIYIKKVSVHYYLYVGLKDIDALLQKQGRMRSKLLVSNRLNINLYSKKEVQTVFEAMNSFYQAFLNKDNNI